jgi:arsenate reductase
MVEVTIWHHPGCEKSRRGLAQLQEMGVSVRIVLYLEQPPSIDELRGTLAKLGLQPAALVRKKEPVYAELGLESATPEGLLAAMAAHPVLIERPIVFRDDRAVLGRPPIRVLEILRPAGLPPHVTEIIRSQRKG